MAVALDGSSVAAEDMTAARNKKVQKKVPVYHYGQHPVSEGERKEDSESDLYRKGNRAGTYGCL